MSNPGIDTGTGRPEDYISHVETNTGVADGRGAKMPDLRGVRSEPQQAKPRRGSLLDSFKDALQPGDVRARRASQGASMESPASAKTTSGTLAASGWHMSTKQKPAAADSGLSGAEHHHAPDRHRSHGVMDHLLGRRRSHDDASGIIGSRRERAELGATSSGARRLSKGPGESDDDSQNYSFEVPSGSREDPKRSAIDAVPRTSALDSEGASSIEHHDFSTREPLKGMSKKAGRMGSRDGMLSKKDSKASREFTDSGLY